MKKVFSLLCAVTMTFSLLSGCSGKSTQTAAETSGQASSAASAETNSSDVFFIGGLGPITGSAASYGISVKQGAELAIKEINDAGGVKAGDKTYTFKMDFQDDQASEDKAVPAYNKLQDEKVNAILGCVTSGACLAITDLTKEDNILQITPSGSAAKITEGNTPDSHNVFRVCFTDPIQGIKIADYLVEKGYKSIAVIYNNADEYSSGVYEAFKEEIAAKGSKLVAEESFGKDDNDFNTQLTKIKNAGADVVFAPVYYEAAANITKQAREAGITADFVGSDGWDGVLKQVTDTSFVEGAVFLSPFLSSDSSVKSFTDAYVSAYNATPDQFAADGYDTVYIMKAALEKAGSPDSEALIKAMTEIEVEGVTGKISFDATGEPKKDAKYIKIVNGEYSAL